MSLGLRNTSPPLALSILLTATRRHLDIRHIPSTGSSQEAEGARAVLEDFLEEGGEQISSIPAGASLPTLKSPKHLFKGKNLGVLWGGAVALRGLANLGSLGTWVAKGSQLLLGEDPFGEIFVSFLQPISPQNSWRGTLHTTLNC